MPSLDKQMTHARCKPVVFLPWSHKHDSLAKGADAQFQSRELRASSLLGSIPLCVLGHSPGFVLTPLSGLSLSPDFVLRLCDGMQGLGGVLGRQGSWMSGLDLVHDAQHFFRGRPELGGWFVPLSVLPRCVAHVPGEVSYN